MTITYGAGVVSWRSVPGSDQEMSIRHRCGLAIALAIVVGGSLVGCRGKLLATAELHGPGKASVRFVPNGAKVVLWADTDAKWKGAKSSKPDITYEIDVRQAGKVVGHTACSTAAHGGTSICGSTTNLFGTLDADCEIALACMLPTVGPGEVELQVTGATGNNVVSVKKMSLNLRED